MISNQTLNFKKFSIIVLSTLLFAKVLRNFRKTISINKILWNFKRTLIIFLIIKYFFLVLSFNAKIICWVCAIALHYNLHANTMKKEGGGGFFFNKEFQPMISTFDDKISAPNNNSL